MTDLPLSGRSIVVATPCMDGKYDRAYVRSFYGTFALLKENGAGIDFMDLPGCSDLPMARAKLFTHFLKSEHTDLFFADSDMGWDPKDVLRIALTKKDFVGGAGPKKKYPLEFAFHNFDDGGTPLPFTLEGPERLIDITKIGMAFMMISKACAERMATHYEEECAVENDGEVIYFVFDPIRLNRSRRLSEDFAFCYRWKQIGGKIHIIPDIVLSHTGSYTWQGSFMQVEQQEQENGQIKEAAE